MGLKRQVALAALAGAMGLAGAWMPTAAADRANAQRVIELSPAEAGLKGVVGHWWFFDANLQRFLDAYSDLGVTTVRIATDWGQIEPEEGRRDFHMLHDTEDEESCCYGLLGPPPDFASKRLAYEAFRSYVVRR